MNNVNLRIHQNGQWINAIAYLHAVPNCNGRWAAVVVLVFSVYCILYTLLDATTHWPCQSSSLSTFNAKLLAQGDAHAYGIKTATILFFLSLFFYTYELYYHRHRYNAVNDDYLWKCHSCPRKRERRQRISMALRTRLHYMNDYYAYMRFNLSQGSNFRLE